MKKIGSVVLCCLGVAAIGGSVAQADNASNPNWVAAHECTTELHAMGVKNFKALYGDPPKFQHAMRNCQREHGKHANNVVNNAAQQCKTEQADPTFATTHGGLTFDQFYGTNANDKNSFGKCVSTKAKEAVDEEDGDVLNAAQQCRAERNGDPDAFKEKYGSNKNKKNAFGKCVSQLAKAQHTD